MRYSILTNLQVLVITLFTGLIAGGVGIGFSMYREFTLLPVVHLSTAGECLKVVNYQNGHAFSCPDVNVLLRVYRTVTQ